MAIEQNTLPDLLTEREAARMLCVSPGTLRVWRCTNRYPLPWIKVGHAVRYSPDAIRAFIESRTVSPVEID